MTIAAVDTSLPMVERWRRMECMRCTLELNAKQTILVLGVFEHIVAGVLFASGTTKKHAEDVCRISLCDDASVNVSCQAILLHYVSTIQAEPV